MCFILVFLQSSFTTLHIPFQDLPEKIARVELVCVCVDQPSNEHARENDLKIADRLIKPGKFSVSVFFTRDLNPFYKVVSISWWFLFLKYCKFCSELSLPHPSLGSIYGSVAKLPVWSLYFVQGDIKLTYACIYDCISVKQEFCHKRGDTSNISHLSATKCKFVLLLSWHAAE